MPSCCGRAEAACITQPRRRPTRAFPGLPGWMPFPSRGSSFQSQVCKLGEQMVCCHIPSGPSGFSQGDQRQGGLSASQPSCLPSGPCILPEGPQGSGPHCHLAFWKRDCSEILTSLVRENFPSRVLAIREAKQTSGHIVPFLPADLSTRGFQAFVPSVPYFPPYHLAALRLLLSSQPGSHSWPLSPCVCSGPVGPTIMTFCALQSCNLPPNAPCTEDFPGRILVYCGPVRVIITEGLEETASVASSWQLWPVFGALGSKDQTACLGSLCIAGLQSL